MAIAAEPRYSDALIVFSREKHINDTKLFFRKILKKKRNWRN
jgi:hypothetical protein